MNNKTLLRRPLPSNRENKHQGRNNDKDLIHDPANQINQPKKPTRLPAIKTTAEHYYDISHPTIHSTTHPSQKKNSHKKQNFDIFEDGDKNLLKPLGPEPFFPTKSIK